MNLLRMLLSLSMLATGLLAIGCSNKSGPSTPDKTGSEGHSDRPKEQSPSKTTETSGKSTPDSVAAVLGDAPAEFRTDFKHDKAVREKMNAWLAANVVGKGKTIKGKVPADPGMPEKGDKGSKVKLELFPQVVYVNGVRWLVMFHDGSFKKRERAPLAEIAFTFSELNQKDAEWFAGLNDVLLDGTVKSMKIVPDEAEGSIFSVTLADLKINGKPFKPIVQGQ